MLEVERLAEIERQRRQKEAEQKVRNLCTPSCEGFDCILWHST